MDLIHKNKSLQISLAEKGMSMYSNWKLKKLISGETKNECVNDTSLTVDFYHKLVFYIQSCCIHSLQVHKKFGIFNYSRNHSNVLCMVPTLVENSKLFVYLFANYFYK